MFTPQQADLESLARAYGWEYRRVANRGELETLLTEPVTGPQLIEAPLDR
jgi:2-succinyl-5-enolpyruvyl-6-hydroxy-3-cyclohexene-1-carboxylate synthase